MSPRLKAKPCANCGAMVPRHEWPADTRWKILCSGCIQAWLSTPTISPLASLAGRRP